MGNGRSPIGGTFEDTGEALEPVRDQLGQAIEAGIQSIVPPAKQITPQQKPQYKSEEQKNLAEARRKIKFWQDLEAAQKKVREEEKQKALQKQQEEERKKQEKTQVKRSEVFQKQKELHPEISAKGKAEIKRGVGG